MMNLFARILSHGFGLIIVALLVIGLVYRGKLFPEWDLPDFLTFDSGPEEITEAASGAVKRAGDADAEADDAAAGGVVPAPVEAAADEVAAPAAADDGSVTDSDTAAVEEVPEVVEALEGVVEAAQPVADTVTETPPVTTQDADQVDEVPAPATASPVDGASSYRALAAAREAYWLRDYGLAEQKYKDLIALEPGNPDGYGELGNMYFSRGAWEQAAAAYYEAGVRLVDQGLIREARQLVEVIRGLNGTQADALEQKTRSAEQ
jgi:tetratricopeptide (TPR) repeat protein